jgi:hypothetical protein
MISLALTIPLSVVAFSYDFTFGHRALEQIAIGWNRLIARRCSQNEHFGRGARARM